MPFEYLLAGLGACTSITLRMYADRKGWNIGGVTVSVALHQGKEGRTIPGDAGREVGDQRADYAGVGRKRTAHAAMRFAA
jgi:hypothetical protein